jgi:hypothetical protein
LQRKIRHIARTGPFAAPWARIASIANCEQVGVNLHFGGINGEIHR